MCWSDMGETTKLRRTVWWWHCLVQFDTVILADRNLDRTVRVN